MRTVGRVTLTALALGLAACAHHETANVSMHDPESHIGTVYRAYSAQRSNVEVEDSGTVVRVLGTRRTRSGAHEGALIDVPAGATTIRVKIEDNVDITGPVPLVPREPVRFRGVYVYDPRGGIIHWTHHDPRLRHQPGFLEAAGKRYE